MPFYHSADPALERWFGRSTRNRTKVNRGEKNFTERKVALESNYAKSLIIALFSRRCGSLAADREWIITVKITLYHIIKSWYFSELLY
jgi:hypothetical protein